MSRNRANSKGRRFHRAVKDAQNATKECYFIGCENKTIHAHSIANNRLLKSIAKNGEVMYLRTEEFDKNGLLSIDVTGRAKATTFPGFCDEHDKIFEPIDNHDYSPGNKQQEFLFAMRAAAREYSTRATMVKHQEELLKKSREGAKN